LIFSNQPIQFTLLFILAVIIAFTLHEVAHALVAKWNGDYTAKFAGRITLNPVKHIDIIGFIMLLTVGFGYAKPVPVNPLNFRSPRKGIFLVSIAGVTINFILAFFASFFAILIFRFGDIWASGFGGVMMRVFYYFFLFLLMINVNLIVFNLLPIFPLDGYHILENATKSTNRFTKFMRNTGPYILIGLIIFGALLGLIERLLGGRLPEWANPLGYLIRVVGGRISTSLLKLWGLIFGVYVPWDFMS